MVTVVSVVGARPQFVKLAPVHKSLIANGFEHQIIHTGQHYDAKLSDVFFQEFGKNWRQTCLLKSFEKYAF